MVSSPAAVYAAATAAIPAGRFFHPLSTPQHSFVPLRRCLSVSSNRVGSPTPLLASATGGSPSPSAVDPADLPQALRDIVALFRSAPDERARYQQLLHYGRRLPPMDPVHKNPRNLVHGCTSQVWVRALKDDGGANIRFEADSDTVLVRGIAALLVMGLSGSTAQTIAAVPPSFIELLGLQQSLSRSRNSGMVNMLRLMQKKALEVENGVDLEESEDSAGNTDRTALNGYRSMSRDDASRREGSKIVESQSVGIVGDSGEVAGNKANASADGYQYAHNDIAVEHKSDKFGSNFEEGNGSNSGVAAMEANDFSTVDGNGSAGGRKQRIIEILEKGLLPLELVVEDVSDSHKGHAAVRGRAGANGETHFNVRVVSKSFEGKSMLRRHRLVYDLLKDELDSGLHALSIDAKTPSEQ